MRLILENDHLARQHSIRWCILRQKVIETVGMKRRIRSQPPYPLLLYDKLVIGLHLLLRDVLLFELDDVGDVGAAGLGFFADAVAFDRGLFVDAVDLHPQLGHGRQTKLLIQQEISHITQEHDSVKRSIQKSELRTTRIRRFFHKSLQIDFQCQTSLPARMHYEHRRHKAYILLVNIYSLFCHRVFAR